MSEPKLTVKRLGPYRWELPQSSRPDMRVPGLIYASAAIMESVRRDQSLTQVANGATLPGVVKASLAMPDIHFGYGLPIGGVLASGGPDAVVSPGGVGFDINCGVRALRSDLAVGEIRDKIRPLVEELYRQVPAGVGSSGKIRLKQSDLGRVLRRGAAWAVEAGHGWPEDLEHTEAGGALAGADPTEVSDTALKRGRDQVGTLGSGNHFIEIQHVDRIFLPEVAEAFGLWKGQVVVMIHSGSRGLGHQVCSDSLKWMGEAARKYGIRLPDRQLACAPLDSPEGRRYLAAMRGAANYAWANRQCMAQWVRDTFQEVLGRSARELGLHLIYDVAHNIVKIEEHQVDGRSMRLAVHRKGATRAFGPGHPELPEAYRSVGQPVLIPGDMGRASYILVGTERAMQETFGSTCHGAGRVLSRAAAVRKSRGRRIDAELRSRGIEVRARGRRTLHEEMPEAYKDVEEVTAVVDKAGISRRVARLRPLGVIKG